MKNQHTVENYYKYLDIPHIITIKKKQEKAYKHQNYFNVNDKQVK